MAPLSAPRTRRAQRQPQGRFKSNEQRGRRTWCDRNQHSRFAKADLCSGQLTAPGTGSARSGAIVDLCGRRGRDHRSLRSAGVVLLPARAPSGSLDQRSLQSVTHPAKSPSGPHRKPQHSSHLARALRVSATGVLFDRRGEAACAIWSSVRCSRTDRRLARTAIHTSGSRFAAP